MNRWISMWKGSAAPLGNMRDLFLADLKELYSIADQIIDAVPAMVRLASAPELQSLLDRYLKSSWKHKSRLDEVFRIANTSPQALACAGVHGIVADGARLIHAPAASDIRDAAILGIVRRISYFKVACYDSAASLADLKGWRGAAAILHQAIEEERRAQQELTQIEAANINRHAA